MTENLRSYPCVSSYEPTQKSSLSMLLRPYHMFRKRKYHYDIYYGVRRAPTNNPCPCSIKEIEYARTKLGAVGTVLLSNHEGHYLGDPLFTPFFQFLDARPSEQEAIFIHPQTPYLRLSNGTLIVANPSKSSRHPCASLMPR